ncbi:TonB-dependent receptor [Sphingomonas koreensis]|nr:TonB-dependent receptor [Sphingomonas koreensis]
MVKLRHLLGATAIVGVLSALPAAAFAQEQVGATTADDSPTDNANGAEGQQSNPQTDTLETAKAAANQVSTGDAGDIVVTGSRLRRPDLESNVPIASIAGAEIYQHASTSLGDQLNNLPQLQSTFSQQNPGAGIGIAGLNLLDLRGLGTQRTLVLVDGRRHVASDLQNNAVSVDINTIPTDLVERIDIVTGGQSAVYGSDAIAGVVNFVLKKDFDGFQVRGGAGIPEYGAGGDQFLSFIAGKNFAEGRGNITIAGEYSHQDRLYASQIPWFRHSNGFVTSDVDSGADTNNSDGIPDRVFVHDIRSATIARFGLIPIPQSPDNPVCGTDAAIYGADNATPYNCNLIFDSAGNLHTVTGTHVSSGPYGALAGGNGDTGNEDKQASVLPLNVRYVANALGHFKFSDAADFFFEAKYARVHTIGSNSGPAFDQGAGVTFNDARANFRLDDPFLSSAARSTIANAILASGQNNGLFSFGDLSDADRAAIADGSYRFAEARNLTDLGLRDEDALRETYRLVAGVRGDISDHWSYEVSGNYGRTNENINILGNVNLQRMMLAFDSGINPATGKIACRSQFDPTAANPINPNDLGSDSAVAASQAELATDIAQCVPYNPFGGPDNSASRNYIVTNSGDHGHLTQIDVTAFVSGDTGNWFNLPGGPIGIVLGGEYRHEDAVFTADPEVESGLTFLNALQPFDPPALEVKEGFAELNLPILKDVPFFHDLSLSGSARVSDYRGGAGTVWAYNAGGEWSPIRGIRFRANYGRAVRAPNYTETASPLTQNFASFEDPCADNRLAAGTQYREANCAAQLGAVATSPTARGLFNDRVSGSYSLEILSGSNPNLQAETSNSLTLGVVLQPSFLPGFAFTADYYNIQVNKVIVSPSAQQIADSCVDLPSTDNQFCALIDRFQGPGTGPDGEVPGQIVGGTLIDTPLNFAKRIRRGIDFEATYNHSIGTDASLNGRLLYTHQLKDSDYQDPTRPNYEDRLLSELDNPKDEFNLNVDLTLNKFTIGYGAHYIGPMVVGAAENYYSVQGRPPENADAYDIIKYPSVVYHDVRLDYLVGGERGEQTFEFYVGINNLNNRKPPLGLTGTGTDAIYDARGRTFFTGFRAAF